MLVHTGTTCNASMYIESVGQLSTVRVQQVFHMFHVFRTDVGYFVEKQWTWKSSPSSQTIQFEHGIIRAIFFQSESWKSNIEGIVYLYLYIIHIYIQHIHAICIYICVSICLFFIQTGMVNWCAKSQKHVKHILILPKNIMTALMNKRLKWLDIPRKKWQASKWWPDLGLETWRRRGSPALRRVENMWKSMQTKPEKVNPNGSKWWFAMILPAHCQIIQKIQLSPFYGTWPLQGFQKRHGRSSCRGGSCWGLGNYVQGQAGQQSSSGVSQCQRCHGNRPFFFSTACPLLGPNNPPRISSTCLMWYNTM